MMARSKIAPLQRPDTLMQLSRSSLSEIRLAPRCRAIHFGTNAILGNVRLSAGFEGEANISRRSQCMSGPTGRRTVKTEPLPGSLVTVTSPPIMRASLRAMARPSPVPPKFCAVAASA
jgi:hypothetical protein